MCLSVLPSLCGSTKARRAVCLPGPWITIFQAKDLPKSEDSRGLSSKVQPHRWPSSTQHKQPSRPASQQASKQSSQSVSQNRLQIWPLQVSQPLPTSRGTVAVGADPGSEISITLGTDCTATTVPYHTGSREILPFRTRAAVCHLCAARLQRTLPPCKHASSTRQVSGLQAGQATPLTRQGGQAEVSRRSRPRPPSR